MNMRSTGIALLLLSLSILAAAGCSKQNGSISGLAPGTGTVQVQMTDAPGEFDAVNLVIQEVAVHIAGADSNAAGGWEVIRPDSATYDLLTLRNGVFTTIGKAAIPAGHYTQVRLKLGPGSNVVVGGVPHPLTVPSGLQTGLKLVGEFDVPANGLVDIALDFDAARSIILTGAGRYMLKPVVKVMPFSTAGAIGGTVLPAGTATSIYAIMASDTLGSAQAAGDGTFLVSVLPAGTYSLAFHPAAGFRDTTLTGVAVTAGHLTGVGNVQLTAQ